MQGVQQPDTLRGMSVADRANPITTYHQLGGTGQVKNKALAIPLHLGEHIHSLEYVVVEAFSSVGEHQQRTDEIYYLVEGGGMLTTDGETRVVYAGDLVVAPRGTRHSIGNPQSDGLGFLVIEAQAPGEPECSSFVLENLPGQLHPDSMAYEAFVGTRQVGLRVARVRLSAYFAGPWGMLSLLELPPGCRLEPYSLPEYDENLFVVSGRAGIALDGLPEPFLSDEDGLNVFVPANLSRQITNRSSVEPLCVLSVQICH